MPLSLCFLHISVVALVLLAGSAFKATATAQQVPLTRDQPNPIAHIHFNNATGVLNGTLAIVPIPLTMARQVIPQQYGILEAAYRELLPDFPEGMYPVLVQAAHDHDVRFQDFQVDDFSRAGYEFPFLDLLHDGHSSFRWAPEQIITASNDIAVHGSRAYGTIVHPGSFFPPVDAYERLPSGETVFNATGFDGMQERYMNVRFNELAPAPEPFPFPMSFFVNVTNQPIFVNGSSCDQMIRLFNTSLTTADEFIPVPVKGRVHSNIGPFGGVTDFDDVLGFQLTTVFVENNYLPCEVFRNYQLPADF